MDNKTNEILQKFSTQKVDLTLEKFQITTKEIDAEVQRLERDAVALKKEVSQLLNRYYSTEAKVEDNKKQAREYTNLLNKLGIPKANTIDVFDKVVNKFKGLNTATKMKGFINNF
tara:strand:- start:16 stop:360 length:345 start_codon:yes stop_codon:yes gene_type:complete